MIYENEKTEFKSTLTDSIYKEVIAFANSDGGKIYIGIDDNGNKTGLPDIDSSYTKLTNGIRDAIAPDVTMFIKYNFLPDNIICIDIAEGTSKPYYLKSKGLKPSGVYVRQGTSCAPASFEEIRHLIKTSDSDIFEASRSIEQQLTFDSAKETFYKHGITFSEDKFAALGIVSLKNNLYTNLAGIISDQCEHTIKVAVFADDTNTVFKAHREFTGSIFKQLDEAFDYISLCNQNRSEFSGIERIDIWDYPQDAIREALLNAIVHRDYSFSGSIIINVNDSSIEFISLGGLLPGLSPDDIRTGISQPRNRNLAEMFHRLGFIESYGTGIRRIYSHYAYCTAQPEIIVTANTFKLLLPNRNIADTVHDNSISYGNSTKKAPLSEQEQRILDFIDRNGEMTDGDVQRLLSVKKTRAYNISKQMERAGLIEIVGRGTQKRYRRK